MLLTLLGNLADMFTRQIEVVDSRWAIDELNRHLRSTACAVYQWCELNQIQGSFSKFLGSL